MVAKQHSLYAPKSTSRRAKERADTLPECSQQPVVDDFEETRHAALDLATISVGNLIGLMRYSSVASGPVDGFGRCQNLGRFVAGQRGLCRYRRSSRIVAKSERIGEQYIVVVFRLLEHGLYHRDMSLCTVGLRHVQVTPFLMR